MQAAQEAAAAAGFQLGVDLGARGSCQIGGNLATNAGGNGVLQFGMMREQVLGLEVVLADGTVLDMMRPMIKNNTGYDLKHWFVGSEGTLGIITRAILRLHPAKRARVSTLVALPDYAAAIRLLRLLQSNFPGALAAFELMWEDFFTTSLQWSQTASPFGQTYPFAVLADVTGSDEAALAERLQGVLAQAMDQGLVLDAVVAQTLAQASSLWRIREASAEFPSRLDPINFDISLPIEGIGAFADTCIEALSQRWPGHRSLRFGHLGDGNLHLTTDARSLGDAAAADEASHELQALVYELLARQGGSISAEHGIGLHKKPYLDLSRSAAELTVMRAIKQALDPLNLLNPGKVFDLHPESTKAPHDHRHDRSDLPDRPPGSPGPSRLQRRAVLRRGAPALRRGPHRPPGQQRKPVRPEPGRGRCAGRACGDCRPVPRCELCGPARRHRRAHRPAARGGDHRQRIGESAGGAVPGLPVAG